MGGSAAESFVTGKTTPTRELTGAVRAGGGGARGRARGAPGDDAAAAWLPGRSPAGSCSWAWTEMARSFRVNSGEWRACTQPGRVHLPKVHTPIPFDEGHAAVLAERNEHAAEDREAYVTENIFCVSAETGCSHPRAHAKQPTRDLTRRSGDGGCRARQLGRSRTWRLEATPAPASTRGGPDSYRPRQRHPGGPTDTAARAPRRARPGSQVLPVVLRERGG